MIVVFNASPIIFLSKLNFVEKALSLFEICYVPESVIDEILFKTNKNTEIISKLLESRKLVRVRAKNKKLFNALHKKLGKGEAEVIAFAIENEGVNFVILDDHVARREALKLGLQVKGTLGIIKRLWKLGEISISSIDDLYQRLSVIEFRVRSEVFEKIFKD